MIKKYQSTIKNPIKSFKLHKFKLNPNKISPKLNIKFLFHNPYYNTNLSIQIRISRFPGPNHSQNIIKIPHNP